jgi:hypothetical protein
MQLRFNLALLMRYQKVFVVHDDDKAGDRGRDYIASLKAIGQRIKSISPPAHDLTDFWRADGNLRFWVASYVSEALQETTIHALRGERDNSVSKSHHT